MGTTSWAVAAALLGLALQGCGDSEPSPRADSTTTTAPVSTTTAATAGPPETTTTTTSRSLSEESTLAFDGIGPIKVGMTLAEASAAAGQPVEIDPGYVLDGCAYAEAKGGPKGLSFMVLRDKATDPWRIVRVNVFDDSRIATLSGIRIGATEAEVKSTYSAPDKTGKVVVEQHHYDEAGHYITYDVDGPAGHLMLFETDGQRVDEFRSGNEGPVRYVEGCA